MCADDFYRNKKLYDSAQQANKERYNSNSKKRLTGIISKKFQTTMIGALAAFEKHFGDLWGHEQEHELNDEQLENLEDWQRVREEILENGNTNLRSVLDELNQHTIKWDRYQTTIIVQKN